MATRPAKRQRRSTIIVSDDEVDAAGSNASSTHTARITSRGKKSTGASKSLQTRNKPSSSVSQSTSNKASPQSSPNKTRQHSKQNFEAKNNKSLHNFFSRATDEQRWQRKANIPQPELQQDLITDDIIDDDSLDDDIVQFSQGYSAQQTGPSIPRLSYGSRIGIGKAQPLTSSQKFAKPATIEHNLEPPNTLQEIYITSEHRPWADRYAPATVDEIGVHKKKITDVQKWLESAVAGKLPQKVLVLKGPAGSGKSTVISLLAKSLNIEVLTWRNPVVTETGNVSSMQQFAEFLDRGGQFQALALDGVGDTPASSSACDKKLLLVEEFPVSMSRSSDTLDNFRSVMLQYLLRNTTMSQFGRQKVSDNHRPLVLIISESLVTSSTALSDSFTAHRLLGPELSNHPLLTSIEFNHVAATFVSKAIDLVIKKEARDSGRRRTPGPAVIQHLTSVGDLRSAINSLEFLCARNDDAADWSGTVAVRSKKVPKQGVPSTEAEKNALQLISLRESTLDMFHATGKIVYNKREDPRVLDSRAEPPPKPPDHLMYVYTPKISQVDIDALLSEMGTDIQTFISTLHENYVLSCNGESFVSSFEGCSEFLSDSDFLNPESRSLVRAKGNTQGYSNNLQSGNSEMLRQDELSFHVASRGLLFSLPFPVNRAVPSGARKQDAFKMFYPTSLRLWKPAEEIHDLVSIYSKGVTEAEEVASFNFRNIKSGVAAWKARSYGFGLATSVVMESPEADYRVVPCTSQEQLVTELLPFLMCIRAAHKEDTEILKKITQLRGIDMPTDGTFDDEQDREGINPLSGSAKLHQRVEEVHGILQAQKLKAARNSKSQSHAPARTLAAKDETAQDKLYISDDDIQDD